MSVDVKNAESYCYYHILIIVLDIVIAIIFSLMLDEIHVNVFMIAINLFFVNCSNRKVQYKLSSIHTLYVKNTQYIYIYIRLKIKPNSVRIRSLS